MLSNLPARILRKLYSAFFGAIPFKDKHPSLKTRLWLEELERRLVPAAIPVTVLTDTGAGSLRQQ